MPIYEFRCQECGPFDAVHRMSEVPRTRACPICGQDARRLFSTVGLSQANSARARAMDDAARSAEAPDVVSSLPRSGGGGTRTTHDPRHLKLPRP